jgi:hypothetical protein
MISNILTYKILFNYSNVGLFRYYKAAHILCPLLSASNNESGIVVSVSTNSIQNVTFILRLDVQKSFNVL